MNLAQLKTFIGWCSVINLGLLLFTSLMLLFFRELITEVWANLFGGTEAQSMQIYMIAIAVWKVLIFTFFIVPYFALKYMLKV